MRESLIELLVQCEKVRDEIFLYNSIVFVSQFPLSSFLFSSFFGIFCCLYNLKFDRLCASVIITIIKIQKISITPESSPMSLCCHSLPTPSPRQLVNCFQSLRICFALRLMFKNGAPDMKILNFYFLPQKKN